VLVDSMPTRKTTHNTCAHVHTSLVTMRTPPTIIGSGAVRGEKAMPRKVVGSTAVCVCVCVCVCKSYHSAIMQSQAVRFCRLYLGVPEENSQPRAKFLCSGTIQRSARVCVSLCVCVITQHSAIMSLQVARICVRSAHVCVCVGDAGGSTHRFSSPCPLCTSQTQLTFTGKKKRKMLFTDDNAQLDFEVHAARCIFAHAFVY